jgi:predicted lysophospholipase L1 biosynthesis ABC-type transport system permease subunit
MWNETGRETMMNWKHGFALAIVMAVLNLGMPAVAATTYYVAQDAKTHECKVTKKKPKGRKSMMVGRSAFNSKEEAKSAMRAAAACSGTR